MIAAACQPTDIATPSPTAIPLIELPTHALDAAGGVEYEGSLRTDGQCFWLTSGTATLSVIWPPGFAGIGGAHPAVVRNGLVVAEAGDTLSVDATVRADVRPSFCAIGTSTLLVGSVDAVNGRQVSRPTAPEPTAPARVIR